MIENTRKGIDRKFKIMQYAWGVEKFIWSDIIHNLVDFGAQATLNRDLQELVKEKWIEHNTKTKEYRKNPFIKTLDQDIDKQIKEGIERVEEILRKKGEQKEKIKIEIASSFEKELILRNRIMKQTDISFYFNEEKVNKKLVFNEGVDRLIKDLVYSLLRNVIIMAPENFKVLPEEFNIGINIKANLNQDPNIKDIIIELKNEYKTEKKRIPHTLLAPFNINEVIEIPKEHEADFEDYSHKKAFYREKYEKKIIMEKLNGFENLFSQTQKFLLSPNINEAIKNSEFKDIFNSFEEIDLSEIKINPSKILDIFDSIQLQKIKQLFDKEVSE